MKKLQIALLLFLGFYMLNLNAACSKADAPKPIPEMSILVPTKGNSWFFRQPGTDQQQVFNFADQQWNETIMVMRTWFRLEQAGEVHLGIMGRVESGISRLECTFQGQSQLVELSGTQEAEYFIGSFKVEKPGYYYLDIKGTKKEGPQFAVISDVLLGGDATLSGVYYSNEDYFYWGRRGPSVHLTYEVPQQAADIQWFYNEVTVPAGNDVQGSFFMANGFAQGYFGFQVNSHQERRILFSVWSPFVTDNPSEIPPEYVVELLDKGTDVITQEFGNEGSGGQSFFPYNWRAGTTYKFLLGVNPSGNNKTDYTAYFFAPETGQWKLIASWRRPFTDTYAKGLHSFLENFNTRTGPLMRQALYNNQWVRDTKGDWYELTRARFTADATARAKARLDYAGGLFSEEEGFFLKNCGFFDETTPIDSWFTRKAAGISPDIDLIELP